jgi:hypothetical protein
MEANDSLLFPQPRGWQFRLIFGSIFLIPSILGLYYSIRQITSQGGSWDCSGNVFATVFVLSLLLIFNQRIHEFKKQNQSLATYWGIGLPIGSLYLKLPWVWRNYSGKSISKLKVHRTNKRDTDDYSGQTRFYTYHIKAMIGRKLEGIADYSVSQHAADKARDIGEFLGVPVDNKLPD